jgi:hypothetical protein
VSIFSDATHHRTFSQPPLPIALKTYLDHNFPGASVTCTYEASKLGYWICRQLRQFGYQCLIVNAADIPTSNKESSSKTDPSDSRKIGKALRAGLLTSIHVPDPSTEGDRQLFRYRKRLLADLTRVKNRIKDKFLFKRQMHYSSFVVHSCLNTQGNLSGGRQLLVSASPLYFACLPFHFLVLAQNPPKNRLSYRHQFESTLYVCGVHNHHDCMS